MSNNNRNFQLEEWEDAIDAYVCGEMSEAERQEFELSMQQIPALQKEVTFNLNLMYSVQTYDIHKQLVEEMKQHITQIQNNDTKPKHPTSKVSTLSKWIIFGSIGIMLVIVGKWLWSEQQKQYLTKQAQLHITPLEMLESINFRREDSIIIAESFLKGNYEETERRFQNTENTNNKGNTARLLYGSVNALLLVPPKTDTAIQGLMTIVQETSDDSTVKDIVYWYLALSYLQKADKEKALFYLQKISINNIYLEKSKNLIIKLNQ